MAREETPDFFAGLDQFFIETKKSYLFPNEKRSVFDLEQTEDERIIQKFVDYSGITAPAIRDYNARIRQMFNLVNMTSLDFNPGTKLQFVETSYERPKTKDNEGNEKLFFPADARRSGRHYAAEIRTTIQEIDSETGQVIQSEDGFPHEKTIVLQRFPIMLGSELDNLSEMTDFERYKHGEELQDPFGYFIINGREYLIVLFENLRLDKFIFGESTISNTNTTKKSVEMISDNITGTRKTEVYSNSQEDIIRLIVPFLSYEKGSEVSFEIFDIYQFLDPERFLTIDLIEQEILKFVPKHHQVATMKELMKNKRVKINGQENARDKIILKIAEIKSSGKRKNLIVEQEVEKIQQNYNKYKQTYLKSGERFLEDEENQEQNRYVEAITNPIFRRMIDRLLDLDLSYFKINGDSDKSLIYYGAEDETDEKAFEIRTIFFGKIFKDNQELFILPEETKGKGKKKDKNQRLVIEIYTMDDAYKKYTEEFYQNFFPKAPNKEAKIVMISLLVSRLLLFKANIVNATDRNSWSNIKYKTPGEVLFRTFSSLFNNYRNSLENNILTELYRNRESMYERKINFFDFFKGQPGIVQEKIISNFLVNNWNMRKNSDKKNAPSQMLKRDNYNDMLGHLTMSTTSAGSRGSIEAKQLHNSEIMYVCPGHTPEGENCGRVKHIALSGRYTSEKEDAELFQTILTRSIFVFQPEQDKIHNTRLLINEEFKGYVDRKVFIEALKVARMQKIDSDIQEQDEKTLKVKIDVPLNKIASLVQSYSDVFSTPILFNGVFLGYVKGDYAYRQLKKLKRTGHFPQDMSVIYDSNENIFYLYTSAGRLVRPVYVIDPDTGEVIFDRIQKDENTTIEDLLRQEAIEMLDVFEQEYSLIARDRNDIKHRIQEQEEIEREITRVEEHLDGDKDTLFVIQRDNKKIYVTKSQLKQFEEQFKKQQEDSIQATSESINGNIAFILKLETETSRLDFQIYNIEENMKTRRKNFLKSFEKQAEKILPEWKKMNQKEIKTNLQQQTIQLGKDQKQEIFRRLRIGGRMLFWITFKSQPSINIIESATEKIQEYQLLIKEEFQEKQEEIKVLKQAVNELSAPKSPDEALILETNTRKLQAAKNKVNQLRTNFNQLREDPTYVFKEIELLKQGISRNRQTIQENLSTQTSHLGSLLFDYSIVSQQKLQFSRLPEKQTRLALIKLKSRLRELKKKSRYHYLEIDPNAMFGLAANTGIYNHMNMGPRNVYATSHVGSAIGIHHGNEAYRFDDSKSLLAPQTPLVTSEFSRYSRQEESGAGAPVTVCFANYSGFGVEDAIILNKRAIDNGLLYVMKRKVFRDDTSINNANIKEYFGVPPDGTPGKRKNKNVYRFIDPKTNMLMSRAKTIEKRKTNVSVGEIANYQVYLREGDCVIAKYRVIPDETKENRVRYQDASTYIKKGGEGVVEKVYYMKQTVKVKLLQTHRPETGDKFTTIHAQKGVAGIILNDIDMPFTESGMTPDLIVNSLGIPSRMTIGQILEFLVSKAAAIKFTRASGTSFRDYDLEEVKTVLQENGFERQGNESFTDGRSGVKIPMTLYTGIVYLRSLKHLVGEKIQARSVGHFDQNRQPVRGKEHGGGLRVSTNKRSAITAHGAMNVLRDRMITSSDGTLFDWCECGLIMTKEFGEYTCPVCPGGGKYSGYAPAPFIFRRIQAYGLASGMRIGLKIQQDEKLLNLMERAGVKIYETS